MTSRTAKFYHENPDARKKKQAYDKKHNAKPDQRKYRSELNQKARDMGIYGKREAMGKDLSHTKGGGMVLESTSKNRARNGAKKGKDKNAKRTGTKK